MRAGTHLRLWSLTGLLIACSPLLAAAEPMPPKAKLASEPANTREALFTARAAFGLGTCDLGFVGGGFDLAAARWLGPHLGVGPRIALLGATEGPLGGLERTTVSLAPELSVRFWQGSTYWVASAAVGGAYFAQADHPFCLGPGGGGCAGNTRERSGITVAGSLSFGPVMHLHSFAFAPSLRLDAIPQGYTALVQLGFGATWWTRAQP